MGRSAMSRPRRSRVDVLPVHRRSGWTSRSRSLVGLLVFALARPDLPQFAGKAMWGRAIAYPIGVMIVPVAWWFSGRRPPYPYAIDILLSLPFLIDVAGNAADLYDTIGWWDDLNHFVNWGLLSAAFGQFLIRLNVGRLEALGLTIGFGGVTAILWSSPSTSPSSATRPSSTPRTPTRWETSLSGLSGSVVAALVTATYVRRGPSMRMATDDEH